MVLSMIIKAIVSTLEENIPNAIALLALLPQMTPEEQELVNGYIESVVANTSILDLKEKDALNYMKLYLKTRKESEVALEDLINDTQRQRLRQL